MQSCDNGVDLRMLVHQSQAGCVIGKGGNKIKKLREVLSDSCFINVLAI